jgi:hypothetical protein
MKLDMCSLRSIKMFVDSISAKYDHVDLVVLDSSSSCEPSAPTATYPNRLGDGDACPQIFVGHTALLHWIRPLLAPPGRQGATAGRWARVVGVTGPLHWLATIRDVDSMDRGTRGGGGMAHMPRVLQKIWSQQVEGAVGRAPYESLGRLLFPLQLARQWRNASASGAQAKAAPVDIRAVGVGMVRSWNGFWWSPVWRQGQDGVVEGWEGLLGDAWWLTAALSNVAKDAVWGDILEGWSRDLVHWEWGKGWLGVARWEQMLAVTMRLWCVCEGILVRPNAVAVRPILKALLADLSHDEAGASRTSHEGVTGDDNDASGAYIDAEGRPVDCHPGQSWRGVDMRVLATQWWSVAHERVAAFESAEEARRADERRAQDARG